MIIWKFECNNADIIRYSVISCFHSHGYFVETLSFGIYNNIFFKHLFLFCTPHLNGAFSVHIILHYELSKFFN